MQYIFFLNEALMQDILFSLLSKKTDQITPRSNFQKHRNQVFPEQQASLPHKIKLILHQRRTRVNARPFNGISTIFFHANLACLPPPPHPLRRMLDRVMLKKQGEEHGNGLFGRRKRSVDERCPRSIILGATDRKKGKFLD